VNWLIYLIAIGAGSANPFQSGANAQLNKVLQKPLPTTLFVYASGLLGVLLIWIFVRQSIPALNELSRVPWWAWLGGLFSIASTMAGLVFAQKLGSGIFTGLNVTAALVVSVLLDHFGWMGFKTHPASPVRLGGCVLMVVGLWLVSKF
jgi:bacterial/archaeal transporter family-2 protein